MQLIAVRSRNSVDSPVAHEDTSYLCLAANLNSQAARGRRNRLGQAAHAAAYVSPYAALAIRLTHDVVEKHVSSPRHRRRSHRPDNGIGSESHFELFRLEPAIENRPRGTCEYLNSLTHPCAESAE